MERHFRQAYGIWLLHKSPASSHWKHNFLSSAYHTFVFPLQKRDGKDTSKPFIFSAYREIILILAVVTVTTYVLSDTSNLILLPALLLGYLLVRILSSNSKLTIIRFVKWVGIFAVYMVIIFVVNILAYFCNGFTGKIDEAKLTEYNHVWALNTTTDDITASYISSHQNPQDKTPSQKTRPCR